VINCNGFGESINKLLLDKLIKSEFPACIGNMAPPLLKNEIMVENSEFKMRYEISEEERIADLDISKLTNHPEFSDGKRFSLTKTTLDRLETIKRNMVDSYMDHINKCFRCRFQDFCFKITQCYLQTAIYNKK